MAIPSPSSPLEDDGRDGPVVPTGPVDEPHALHPTRFGHLLDDAIQAELETGRREDTVEEAKRHILVRIGIIFAGSVVLLTGLAMLVLPGPGLVVVALGLALLASEVPFAERLLDRVKARLPQDENGKLPASAIAMMAVMGVLALGGSVWFTVLRG